jgi:hypothetical protein
MSCFHPLPTPVSSHYTTSSQTSRPFSFSQAREVITDALLPERESDGSLTREVLQPTGLDDGLLRPLMESLRRYSTEVERRAGESLAEYTRQCERAMTSLQNEQDTALSNLRQERASAETNAQNFERKIRVLLKKYPSLNYPSRQPALTI